jgi:ribosomal protein S18 acetylase RimI-like enzyme
MAMPMNTRRATTADIPALCELLTLLFAQEADFTPNVEKQTRGLKLILENPAIGHIYCTNDGDAVIGMVSILFTVSTAEGGPAAWMEDLIIHPTRRGQGLGRRLLQAAICGARSAGCTRITLLTDATNKNALRFYERDGFVRSQMVTFRLHL